MSTLTLNASRPPSIFDSRHNLPPYSNTLRFGERLLAHNRSSGDYTRQVGRSTLILYGQDYGAEMPCYGRGARITGAITIAEPETVSSIVLQIRGKMHATVSNLGCANTKTLLKTRTLDSHDGAVYPPTVLFSVELPSRFRNDDFVWHDLPPSYEVALPDFVIKSTYTISIQVTRHDPEFQRLANEQMITLPFNYIPARGTPGHRTLAGTAHPWRESCTSGLSLFLPDTHSSFDTSQPIPFRIQLAMTDESLACASDLAVRCSIQRTVFVNLHGRPTSRIVTITDSDSVPRLLDGGGCSALKWEGELCCDDQDLVVGAFDAGLVKIEDCVVVEVLTGGFGGETLYLRHVEQVTLAHSTG
ncbi:hypothetical protein FB45DRAFT_941271 [Roridomyces roridus]|uniref:Uncharacterized protein n=1 Tax=Roridomyces roridus TaxID=1738132 RepID=A0AAD7F9V9_9AGAR|nr:hypothetical protein FB45DRAFT_941271 [Roridomyces roridus]